MVVLRIVEGTGVERGPRVRRDLSEAELVQQRLVGGLRGLIRLALLRRLTLSLLKAHPSKDSIARKRFAAALDPSFLEEILRGDGILENP